MILFNIVPLLLIFSYHAQALSESRESSSDSTESDDRPNIIHILIDDVGVNDIGVGNAPWSTPAIDEHFQTGVSLDNYYTSPVCTPTRASTMTGRLPFQIGATSPLVLQDWTLPETPTIAELLKNESYDTHGFGKWHLGASSRSTFPTGRGFDSWTGYTPGTITQSIFQTQYPWFVFPSPDLLTRNDSFDFKSYFVDDGVTSDLVTNQSWVDDASVEALLETLDAHVSRSRSNRNPLFLSVNFGVPHAPIERPPVVTSEQEDRCSNVTRLKRREYCLMMQKLDDGIGRIVQKLKDTGLWENTLITIVSDNGGQPDLFDGREPFVFDSYGSNLPYRGIKGSVFQGGIKVIAAVNGGFAVKEICKSVARKPDSQCKRLSRATKQVRKFRRMNGGQIRVKELIACQDWYTTYAMLGGVLSINDTVDGLDMRDVLFKFAQSPRQDFVLVQGVTPNRSVSQGIVVEKAMKLIVNPVPGVSFFLQISFGVFPRFGGYWNVDVEPSQVELAPDEGESLLLFNLTEDPYEQNNLYTDPEYASTVERMTARLMSFGPTFVGPPQGPSPKAVNAYSLENCMSFPWNDDPVYSQYNGSLSDSLSTYFDLCK